MRRTFLVLVLALSMSAGAPAPASAEELAPLHRAAGEAAEGRYIVVMKHGEPGLRAARAHGLQAEHVYEHALQGFAARMTDVQVEAVRRDPAVAFVEEDQVVTHAEAAHARSGPGPQGVRPGNHNVQYDPPWNLDRIDQRFLPLDRRYRWHRDGSGVDVYILDTGIETRHPDFGGRAYRGYDAFGGTSEDCNGHGTHVAGTAAGNTYGVAKGAYLWSVRVLDCNGGGTYAGVIAGTDWVRQHAASWPTYPAVANYSLGGVASAALDAAVNSLANSGVFVAVAAGGSPPCASSPARAAMAFPVAASDGSDRPGLFGGGGSCIEVFAPGVQVPSAWIGGGTRTLSGTSMASPHAAGVGALLKSYGDLPSSAVGDWIVTNATPAIFLPPPDTTNLLLHKADL